jgi:hypothetical protein
MFYNSNVNPKPIEPVQANAKANKRKLSPSVSNYEQHPKKPYHSDLNNNATKPVSTEFISSKCVVHIYYKNDVDSAINEHFDKSLNKAKRQNKTGSNTSFCKNEKTGQDL